MKRLLILLVVLMAGSTLLASNMGFKLTYSTAYTSYGDNWVGLPWFVSYNYAKDVCTDFGANLTTIGHWSEATNAPLTFACSGKGTGWVLTQGEGLLLRVTAATPWVIVGSHDPSVKSNNLVYTAYGDNWVSVPYHTTAAYAKDLCTEVGANMTTIGHWSEATNAPLTFACSGKGTGWVLTTGEAILMRMTATTSWTPAHY